MRYQAHINRQVEKDGQQLERLQSQRKAKEASKQELAEPTRPTDLHPDSGQVSGLQGQIAETNPTTTNTEALSDGRQLGQIARAKPETTFRNTLSWLIDD